MDTMKTLFIIFCMVISSTGMFWPQKSQSSTEPEAYNVCVYSKDPSKFDPKCFMCPKLVYINSLQACVNGTTMPSNITYDSANCLEKNCGINYPTQSTKSTQGSLNATFLIDAFAKLLRLTRSVDNNAVDDSPMTYKSLGDIENTGRWLVIGQVETYASDSDFVELDYTT